MALGILLKKRDFGLLWVAQLISFIGDAVFGTALMWWSLKTTGSGTVVGLIQSISTLPAVVLGPFAGTLADRLRPKVLLVGSDLFRALLTFGFGILASRSGMDFWNVAALCGLLSAASIFHSPTTLTVIPRVVSPEQLDEAMALHTIVRDISKLVGPAIGGAIITIHSAAAAFFLDSLSFVVSSILIILMKIGDAPKEETGESVMTQLVEGFRYVRKQKTLFSMLIGFGWLNLFVVPLMVFIPIAVDRVFHGEAMSLGACEGVLALGSVLAGLAFQSLFGGIPTSRLLFRVLAVNGLIFLGFGVNSLFPVFLAGLFFLGGCFTAVNVGVLTVFQHKVDPAMKGRFFSFVEVLSFALFPIAMGIAGIGADKLGLPVCFGICGTGVLVLAVGFALLPGLDSPSPPDPAPSAVEPPKG